MIRTWSVLSMLLMASLGTPAPVAAQTIEKWIGAAGRTISKTLQGGSSLSRRARNRRQKVVVVPPLPIRRPLPWQDERAQSTEKKAETIEHVPPPEHAGRATPQAKQKTASNKRKILRKEKKKAALPKKKIPRVEKSWPKTLPQAKAEKAEQERIASGEKEQEKDVWSEVEINIAQARCRHLLKQVDAVTVTEDPIKKGPCGDAAPVQLVSIGQNPQVSISPPATVNCNMVFTLHSWLEKDLQPLAKKYLGAPIIQIENISSYSCRNAYGRKNTRLSEHARANALDIRGFVTANGKRTRLLAHWGPVQRDIVAAKKRIEEAKKAAAEREKKRKTAKAAQKKSGKKTSSEDNTDAKAKKAVVTNAKQLPTTKTRASDLGLKPTQLGGPRKKAKQPKNDKTAGPVDPSSIKIPKPSWSPKAKFLKEAHKRACKIFGTVLGPESNEPHRNHFHVDLAERKYTNFCE